MEPLYALPAYQVSFCQPKSLFVCDDALLVAFVELFVDELPFNIGSIGTGAVFQVVRKAARSNKATATEWAFDA